MNNPLISVVVPVFEVEQFLDRCVKSLINQTYHNIEIILVDDGSPDNCPIMCDNWKIKDNRIRVIHKKNGGLSDARNAGMRIATGEYISFVDSDDWLDLHTFSIVIEKMLLTQAQIGAYDFISVDSDTIIHDFSDKYEILNSEQAIENTIDDAGVRTVVWNKVYHKSVLSGLFFPKDRIHEDEFFTFYALDKAQRIVFLHRKCYYYYQRNNSIMGEYNVRHLDMLEGVRERMLFVKKHYPLLYRKAKLSFSISCIFQYQMLLQHKNLDPTGLYRRKVQLLRSTVKVSRSEVVDLKRHVALYHRISNLPKGLVILCTFLNLSNNNFLHCY